MSQFSLYLLLPTVLRVFFFLPWCVVAGGAILLFPTHLELVFFKTGYNAPLRGIHRFALWADIGPQLVSVFLAFLLVLWYAYPMPALVLASGIVARMVYAWQGFQFDGNVLLGEDDRQSVYVVWKEYMFADALVSLKKTNTGYVLTKAEHEEGDEDDEKEM
ncbi:hypothetical protein H0H81_002167 [Sphagnurus paluster]|uniref:Uncharacterized protein n=1 Tax=Sphagnurus paluster TaxID=117069 RepID=A0A9P7K2Y7_9AGAR|nr:hypothetical protein H0H81_002167 [Sphagnurus paluster]